MKIISVIEDEEIIKKILSHLGLWEVKARPPPGANALPKYELSFYYYDSQLLVLARRLAGGSDKWLYAEGPGFSGIDPEPAYT
jgi:hypothetical protein